MLPTTKNRIKVCWLRFCHTRPSMEVALTDALSLQPRASVGATCILGRQKPRWLTLFLEVSTFVESFTSGRPTKARNTACTDMFSTQSNDVWSFNIFSLSTKKHKNTTRSLQTACMVKKFTKEIRCCNTARM